VTTHAIRENDLVLRHPVYTRVVHWLVAIFFVLALISGFAVYSPWLFGLTALFGGGPSTRVLHPWFSLGFVITFALQIVNWLEPMTWRADDRRWMRHLKAYVTRGSEPEPDYVGFFNAGQKLYFWAIVGSAVVFLLSGIPMWFPATFGRGAVAVSYVLHDIAGLLMLGSFIVHIYEGTAAQPGTFRAMMRGTVEKRWAQFHHPAWYREVTGRDPRHEPRRPATPINLERPEPADSADL
jgi:formate dehydrogenase subunit gamma